MAEVKYTTSSFVARLISLNNPGGGQADSMDALAEEDEDYAEADGAEQASPPPPPPPAASPGGAPTPPWKSPTSAPTPPWKSPATTPPTAPMGNRTQSESVSPKEPETLESLGYRRASDVPTWKANLIHKKQAKDVDAEFKQLQEEEEKKWVIFFNGSHVK